MSNHPRSDPQTKTFWQRLGSYVRRLLSYVRSHVADAVAAIVLATVAIITLLDLFNVISLTTEALSRAAIFAICTFAIGQLTEQFRRQAVSDKRDHILDDLQYKQKEIDENLALLIHRNMEAHQLSVKAREEELQTLLHDTTFWYFRGGSGRWQRSTVLPRLSKITTGNVDYYMQVVDLRNIDLCHRYAAYRAVQHPAHAGHSDPPDGTIENVRADLLACVYAAAWYSARSRIRAKISLMNTYSPLRYDMGSGGLVVTIADPNAPALLARERGWLFTALKDEIERANDELPAIQLPTDTSYFPVLFKDVTADTVRQALLATTVQSPNGQPAALITESDSIDFDDIKSRSFAGRT